MSLNNLNKLLTTLLKQHIPFVAFRLPKTAEIQVFIQQNSFPEKLTTLENLDDKKGFVVSPFYRKSNHPIVFLQPDLMLNQENITDEILSDLPDNNRFINLPDVENTYRTTSKEEFISNVEKIISGINSHEFQKVVISKVQVNSTPYNFKKADFFLKLSEKYPSAMIYLMQIPEVGCWAGATPESLLLIKNDLAKTMSIAGTQKADGQNIETYHWGEKELEEQNLVSDFIENTLHKVGVRDKTRIGPVNLQAGNLIHLQTKFEFQTSEFQNNIGNLVSALHPTPATGGLPKQEAMDFLLKNERHDRSYYAGLFGTINIDNTTNLFVNLRCVQFFEKEYVLYSGAGITSSSVAGNEWEETENKMETMKSVISLHTPKGDYKDSI